jgi:hypothetical protein
VAIITFDKVVLILGVTAIVIVLAYVFRFGRFSRRKQAKTESARSQQSPSDSNWGRPWQSSMNELSQ